MCLAPHAGCAPSPRSRRERHCCGRPAWQPYALVGTSGRLAPLAGPALPTVPAAALPALVVMWDPARPWHVRKGGRPAVVPAGELPFLVGPWSCVQVDPSGWHVGESVCTELVVKTANLRLQGLHACVGCSLPCLPCVFFFLRGT